MDGVLIWAAFQYHSHVGEISTRWDIITRPSVFINTKYPCDDTFCHYHYHYHYHLPLINTTLSSPPPPLSPPLSPPSPSLGSECTFDVTFKPVFLDDDIRQDNMMLVIPGQPPLMLTCTGTTHARFFFPITFVLPYNSPILSQPYQCIFPLTHSLILTYLPQSKPLSPQPPPTPQHHEP